MEGWEKLIKYLKSLIKKWGFGYDLETEKQWNLKEKNRIKRHKKER